MCSLFEINSPYGARVNMLFVRICCQPNNIQRSECIAYKMYRKSSVFAFTKPKTVQFPKARILNSYQPYL